MNAHRMNQEMPRLAPPGADADFYFIEKKEPEEAGGGEACREGRRALALAVKNDKIQALFTQLTARIGCPGAD